jgi:hypothetical protein
MSLLKSREGYYHIPPKALDHKSITSEQLQSDVDKWLAKSPKNEIEPIPIGQSSYLSDLQKSRKRRYGNQKRSG